MPLCEHVFKERPGVSFIPVTILHVAMQELEKQILKAKLKQYHRHLEGKVGSSSEF